MKDFFISYNRHDKQWAEWLAWTLEEADYTVVIQAWDFRPGGNFALDMNRAVVETRTTIAVLSETFLRSDYTAPEWAAAFVRDPRSAERKLIPVRVGECQPMGLLAQIVYVDLVGVPEAEAKQRLLDGLQERAKPNQKPSFPGAVTPKAERTEPQPVAFPGSESMGLPKLTLSTFQFDVLTVNERGREVNRKRGQAQYMTENLGNSVGLEMVSIPAGSFFMGLPQSEEDRFYLRKPQHYVTVEPFLMGKYLVTQEQWRAVVALSKLSHVLYADPSRFKEAKRPVEQVSWFEAVEFCNRLSRKTGRQYRLPSETQWEYACRAGTTTPFHFGESLTPKLARCKANFGSAFLSLVSIGETAAVGSFPPNAFGLYDMHGNVWEWCADHWHDNYEGAPNDSSAWVEGGNSVSRPRRGGSWYYPPFHCRSDYRLNSLRDDRAADLGFRVVCAAP